MVELYPFLATEEAAAAQVSQADAALLFAVAAAREPAARNAPARAAVARALTSHSAELGPEARAAVTAVLAPAAGPGGDPVADALLRCSAPKGEPWVALACEEVTALVSEGLSYLIAGGVGPAAPWARAAARAASALTPEAAGVLSAAIWSWETDRRPSSIRAAALCVLARHLEEASRGLGTWCRPPERPDGPACPER